MIHHLLSKKAAVHALLLSFPLLASVGCVNQNDESLISSTLKNAAKKNNGTLSEPTALSPEQVGEEKTFVTYDNDQYLPNEESGAPSAELSEQDDVNLPEGGELTTRQTEDFVLDHYKKLELRCSLWAKSGESVEDLEPTDTVTHDMMIPSFLGISLKLQGSTADQTIKSTLFVNPVAIHGSKPTVKVEYTHEGGVVVSHETSLDLTQVDKTAIVREGRKSVLLNNVIDQQESKSRHKTVVECLLESETK
jgi:hypothetical protein